MTFNYWEIKMQKNINRRHFLKLAGLTLGSAIVSGCGVDSHVTSSTQRPNIIFIMADDHASHAISCYGSRINKTPNLDKLAAQGMRFDNCFCTNSICSPSRAVILTGKYSHLNGVVDNGSDFDTSQQTFPKLLDKAGYQTALIGKWHLSGYGSQTVSPASFDHYCVLIGDSGQGSYFDPVFRENGKQKRIEGYVTDIVTDLSIEWLNNRQKDKPFCLMLHHKAPHRHWRSDDEHESMYRQTQIPEPVTFDDDYKTREQTAGNTDLTIEKHLIKKDYKATIPDNLSGDEIKKWKYQHFIKDYLRTIASIDGNLGRLLDFLDEQNLADNTLIVYTSDQGFFLGDHGLFDKRFMYEESLRMPLVMRLPKMISAGSLNKDIVLNLDFAPTFVDLAGVNIPSDIQGRSLKPLLNGNTPSDWRQSMYYHYYEYPYGWGVRRHYGIRTHKYKLIHFYYDCDIWELYDLEKDPYELTNIYSDPAYDEVITKLKAELASLREKYGDSDELAQKFIEQSKNK